MRIYTNENTWSNLTDAARKAGVTFDRELSFTPVNGLDENGNRTVVEFESGFDVILSGDSRRHQNGGENKAATWDQWGVFIGWLLHIDPAAKIGPRKHPYYDGRDDFDTKTDGRFSVPGVMPHDAHGDHTFRYDANLGCQSCTKCSACMVRVF